MDDFYHHSATMEAETVPFGHPLESTGGARVSLSFEQGPLIDFYITISPPQSSSPIRLNFDKVENKGTPEYSSDRSSFSHICRYMSLCFPY